jgi:hypothetical protein
MTFYILWESGVRSIGSGFAKPRITAPAKILIPGVQMNSDTGAVERNLPPLSPEHLV